MDAIRRFVNDDEGQGLIEYALIGVLVAIGAMATMVALTGGINGAFSAITDAITPAAAGS